MATTLSENMTGFIAKNIDQMHRPGVLQEMKRLYLEEMDKFYTTDSSGNHTLDEKFLVKVNCPVCDASPEKSKFEITINGFHHVRCGACTNVYVTPRLKDEFVFEQYSRPSYTYMFKHLIEDTLQFRKDVIATGKYKWVTKRLTNPNAKRLLDIGAGLGENLAVYKEQGWEATGIELNEYAASSAAERFGVKVYNTPIETMNLPENHFDVISMWGVLEHLSNPVAALRKIIPWLAPDGRIALMVPHFDCLLSDFLKEHPNRAERHLDGDKHIVVYSQQGMRYLAEKVGCEVTDMVCRGLDFSSILEWCPQDKETGLYQFIKKALPQLQRSIEENGYGDGLWVLLRKK